MGIQENVSEIKPCYCPSPIINDKSICSLCGGKADVTKKGVEIKTKRGKAKKVEVNEN